MSNAPDNIQPACADQGNLAWFDVTMDGPNRLAEARAKEVCNSCPLLDTCRKVYTSEEFRDVPGVVAGMSHAERFPAVPPVRRLICGTVNGSRMHYKRGEAPCEPCRNAQNRTRQARRQGRELPQAQWWIRLGEQRAEDLRHLVETGAGVDEALSRLDLTRGTLRKWCQRNDCGDLWARLLANPGTGVREGKVAPPGRMDGAA